tara:strand:+ start:426 stop:656 length:231 start_codon:yes stop_codon:yes gene_type:complete
MRAETQTDKVLLHLEKRGSLTPLQAMDLYGIMRLAARIGELRREGHDIASEPFKTPGGATVSRYRLIHEPQLKLFA